jgi:outer membrane cobalamin receptor
MHGVRFVMLVLVLLSAPLAHAQRATLAGLVVDASGAPVPGARISLVDDAGAVAAVARTGTDGRFTVPDVPSTVTLTLRVERPPFAPTVAQVRANADAASPSRIVLELGAVTETVHVVSPLVDATTIDSFGSAATVVSEAQVLDLHALDLASALRRTPGVTISRVNPVGSFGGADGGAVFMRGMGASRPGSEITTSIDGVPFYMGVWGHPLLGLLPVNGIDRITVSKAPQPHVTGNALAAVDVETRRARHEGVRGTVRLSGGAFSTVAQQADVTARIGRWDAVAAQGAARSSGHREDAHGRMANVLTRVGYRVTDGIAFSASVLHVDSVGTDPGEVGRPETKTGRFATEGTLASLSASHTHGRATGTLQVYGNRGNGNWFSQPPPDGDTLTSFEMAGLRWRAQVSTWAGGRLSGGIDVDRVQGDVQFNRIEPAPRATFTGETLTVLSPLVALDHTVSLRGRWSVTPSAGVRSYTHSVFERATAPHAGLVVRRAASVAFRLSYARGVNYPGQEVVALSALIPSLSDTWRGLRPERMNHVEAGVSLTPSSRTAVDAAYFDGRLRDRYAFGFPPLTARPAFVNLGGYRLRGAELSLRQALGTQWQAFGGLTILDPSLRTLPYAPRRALVAGLTGAHGPFSVSVDAQAQSDMYVLAASRSAGAANRARVGGFTVVNVRPAWRPSGVGGRLQLFAAVENLFHRTYAYRPGYPMPGVSVQVGVSLDGLLRR